VVVVVLRLVLCFTGATGALSPVFALFAGRVSSSSSKANRALLLRVGRCEEDIPKACTAGRVMTSSMESLFIGRKSVEVESVEVLVVISIIKAHYNSER